MVTRSAVTTLFATLALTLVACGNTVPASEPSPSSASPAGATPAVPTPRPATPAPTPAATPAVGGVDGAIGGPVLDIEPVDETTIVATVTDAAAKVWRISVSGTGERGGDRWDLIAEAGDVGPVISATEVRDGQVVDVLDLTPFWDGTAAAGGCHATLPVCIESGGFDLPEGEGRFAVRLELPQGQVPLVIRGASAGWEGEPFVLGPWTETDAFPWGEG